MRRSAARAALAVLAAFALASTAARGERAQQGNLIVSLNGKISPRKLPRDHAAPVAIRLSGSIRTADGSPLPRASRIELGLSGLGLLSTRGLAVCPRARLRNADTRQALARCAPALVGSGHLYTQAFIPHQAPFTVRSRLLAFNGRTNGGGAAVWVHGFAADPPAAVVLPFVVRRRAGAFSTLLVARVPSAVGTRSHLARFQLTFARRFTYRGRRRSYLSAPCPAPPGFTAGFLSVARATYSFAGGPRLRVETVRGCRVR